MPIWEYSIEEFNHVLGEDISVMQEKLDEFGKEGWKLVSAQYIEFKDEHFTRVFLIRPSKEVGKLEIGENPFKDYRG